MSRIINNSKKKKQFLYILYLNIKKKKKKKKKKRATCGMFSTYAHQCPIIWNNKQPWGNKTEVTSSCIIGWIFFSFFFFFSCFVWPHVAHMEVPRLRVQSELQLPATRDPSRVCDLHQNLRQCGIFKTYLARLEIEPASSWILGGFVIHWATTGTTNVLIW